MTKMTISVLAPTWIAVFMTPRVGPVTLYGGVSGHFVRFIRLKIAYVALQHDSLVQRIRNI